jgi:hypothetical protein
VPAAFAVAIVLLVATVLPMHRVRKAQRAQRMEAGPGRAGPCHPGDCVLAAQVVFGYVCPRHAVVAVAAVQRFRRRPRGGRRHRRFTPPPVPQAYVGDGAT